MNDRTRKMVVYGSLVLAVLYAVVNFTGGRKEITGQPPATIEPLTASQTAAPKVSERELQKIREAAWGRDPFDSPRQTVVAGPRLTWRLKGIVFNPARPLAYINGIRVGIGDIVNNAEVIAIEKTKVTLDYQGDRFDVYVQKG